MVASLLSIISKGMQNERLQPPDDQPDLGSFKTVLVKTGRYGTQWARLDFDTLPDFGRSAIIRLVTQGELIGRIMLVTQMPDIMTQQRKAYYTRKPIYIYSGDYTGINLFQGTDFLTTVKFTYSGGSFTGVQFDDLIPGGTYSLNITRTNNSLPPTPFVAILSAKPLTNAGFSLLGNKTFLVSGLTLTGNTTNTNLYAYSLNGSTWTTVSAPSGITQGQINGIGYNGSYYISAGSCSAGTGLIAQDNALTIQQPKDGSSYYTGWIYAFATNGTILVGGGKLNLTSSGVAYYITLSYDGGLTWSSGYFSASPANEDDTIRSIAWSPALNRFIAGGEFYTSIGEFNGLFSLSTPNNPTIWSNPSFPLAKGSSTVYTKSQAALGSLASLFTNGQPLYTWNSSFSSVYANYSSIGILSYGSETYTNPIFSVYSSGGTTSGVYDLFSDILTSLEGGKAGPTITGSIAGTTLTLATGSLTPPCYITGPNVLRGTFVLSSISATEFIVNISQTAALNTITVFNTLTNFSLIGGYASFITSLSANFLDQLAYITGALVTLGIASSTVTTETLTPVLGPVSEYYSALQAIIGSSQASTTIDRLNTIVSNIITPLNYNSTTISSILAAKALQSSYSPVLYYTPSNPVSFQGSITGTTLRVTSITPTYAVLAMNSSVTGTGVTAGTLITGINYTYTTASTVNIPTEVFTATNTPVTGIVCTVSGRNLVITSNPNNIDLSLYQYPLPISGGELFPEATILSGSGVNFIVNTEYSTPFGANLTISPIGSVKFSGSITSNVLTVYSASLASMVTPFTINSTTLVAPLSVSSVNAITYTVNTSQTVTGTLSANVTPGIYPALQNLNTVLTTNIIPNQGSIIETLTYLPQLMQACDNVSNACIQASAYYYSTMLPSDNRNFGLIAFLDAQYIRTQQYTQSTVAPTLFWQGTPLGNSLPVFNVYPTSYTYVQSGYVSGIAVNGTTIVMVGRFYRTRGFNQYLGTMITSTDSGATWSPPFDPGYVSGDSTPYTANAILYTGNVWVATGRWSSGIVSISVDGVNWNPPVSPLNEIGTGLTLATSPTGLLLGGTFTKVNGSAGSLSVASGNTIGFTWGSFIRPTPLLLNSVNVTRVQEALGTYVAVGQWLSIAGSYLASIYTSTDYLTWTPATLFTGITRAICYSVCASDSIWVAVGRFEGSAGSILISDSIGGTSWTTAPIGPGGLTTGTGYGCLFNNSFYFFVGSWSTGVIAISISPTKEPIPSARQLTGSTGGTAYCIAASGLSTYIVGGSFLKTNGTYGTLSTISSVTVTFTFTDIIITYTTTAPVSPAGVNTASSLSATKGVAVNSSIYVAVGLWVLSSGTNASISYSYDGITWQTPINPNGSLGEGLSVTWNGTQFIATGTWSTGSLCVSSDGITWTTPIHPPQANTGSGTSALWNVSNKQWLLSGSWIDANTTPLGNLTSFFYGITFSPSFNPVPSANGSTTELTWDSTNSQWIAVGAWTDGINTGNISKSSDGFTWSNPYTPPTISPIGCQFFTVNRLLNTTLLGGIFTFNTTPVQRSTDGITWDIRYPQSEITGIGQSVTWLNSRWYMAGSFRQTTWGQGIRGPFLLSTDGLTWNSILQIPLTDPIVVEAFTPYRDSIPPPDILTYYINATIYSIAYSGTAYVATGTVVLVLLFNGSEVQNILVGTILYSTDGLTWSVQVPNLPSIFSSTSSGRSVAWNGTVFVLTGNWPTKSGPPVANILYSRDGLTWTVASGLSDITGVIYSVAWSGYRWVAVGKMTFSDGLNATVTTSLDGITWTTPTDPRDPTGMTENSLTSITWNGTRFSAVGTSPGSAVSLTLISRDGLTWTSATLALSSSMVSVASVTLQPFIAGQPFDPSITITPPVITLPNQGGVVLQWSSNATYGAGTQYSLNLTDQTFTFTALQRTQWLSYGSYYNSADEIQFTLTKLTPLKVPFVSDLVGPHFSWTNSVGHALIDTVSLSIGGENVETIPGQLMEILDEFQTPLEKVDQMSKLLCRAENGFGQETFGLNSTSQTVVTPLPFWFSRGDPGCALPIDALNVDEVRLTVNFRPITSLYYTDSRAAVPAQVEGGSLWPIAGSPFYYQDSSGSLIPGLEPISNPGQKFLPFPNLNMTTNLTMPTSYLLVEYIYLDKAEANRFRIADLQVPIVQHYTIDPVDTTKNTYVRIPLEIPNPTRDIFFFCQRYEAPGLNAHFLASRDISSYNTPGLLWWPDASGLYTIPKPGFSTRDSEPIRWLALNYAESLNRFTTENVALFRSLLPAVEQRKAPWINRYYYNLPFGSQNGLTPFSMPVGEANLDKIRRFHLSLGFHGTSDLINDDIVDRYIIRVYGETYNIFRVYGGRGSMMFAY